METRILDLLLAGDLDYEQVLPWLKATQDKIEIVPAVASKVQQQQQHEEISVQASSYIQPVLLREAVLIAVREEAEGLFACLEVNEALTPITQTSRPSDPSFAATACSPGALDESNFPSLGKGPSGKAARKLPPGALMRMVSPSAAEQSNFAIPASRKSSAVKQRITPTAVQSLERNASFSEWPNTCSQPLRSSGHRRKIAPMKLEETAWPSLSNTAGGREQACSSVTSQLEDHSQQPASASASSVNTKADSKVPPLPAAWGRDRVASPQRGSEAPHSNSLHQEHLASPCSSQGSTTHASGCQAAANNKKASSLLDNIASSRQEGDSTEHAQASNALMPDRTSNRRAASGKSGRAAENRDTSAGRPPRRQSPLQTHGKVNRGGQHRKESPNVTPQSRFRPSAEHVQSKGSEAWRKPDGTSQIKGAYMPDKKNFSSEKQSHSEEASAAEDLPKLSFSSAVTGLTSSPQTPQVSQARQLGALPASANPSPQGSVYHTASESGSPTDSGRSSFQEAEAPSPTFASPRELNRNAQSKHAQAVTAALTDTALSRATPQEESAAVKGLAMKTDTAPAPELSLESMSKAVEAELLAESQAPGKNKSIEETAGASTDDAEPQESCFVQDVEINSSSAHSKPSVPTILIPSKHLSEAARLLAKLHAFLLLYGPNIHLCAELAMLLGLLTLPEGLTRIIQPGQAKAPLLWCSEVAAAYTCTVLLEAGPLTVALGSEMLTALHDAPQLQKDCPELLELIDRSLVSHPQKAVPSTKMGASRAVGSFSLLEFTSDGLSKRTPEEQRRVSNREMCRDELLGLLRDASSLKQSFSAAKQPAASQEGSENAEITLIHHRAPALLRKVAPENFTHFAELFTAAVLQAAATGEALLDEELGSLAKQDVSKFQRLNQRLQGPGPRTASNRMPSSPTSSSSGFYPAAPAVPRRTSKATGAAPEGMTSAKAAAAEFPPALRFYVLILEAADSHRLNSNLLRCMANKLQQLWTESLDPNRQPHSPLHLNGLPALALFLSYLTFRAPAIAETSALSNVQGAPFAVDIGTILAQKLAPVDLLRAVQWTAQYLWFLPSDPSSARLVPYSSILQKLAELHISSLTPSREGRGDGTGGAAWHKTLTKIPGCFSTLQVCMRSVLEALAERLGGLPDADSQQLGAFSWLEAESKAQLPRLFQLCCPLLDQARLALQAHAAGSRRDLKAVRPRKIVPSIPSQAGSSSLIPQAVQKQAEGCTDAALLKLQSVFLDMYSDSQQAVRLRDVVSYVAETIGQIVAAECTSKCMDSINYSQIETRIEHQAASICEQRRAMSHADLQALLKPTREAIIVETTPKVLLACKDIADSLARKKVISALHGLCHHTWPPIVSGTAAAIALESAQAVCANALIDEVAEIARPFTKLRKAGNAMPS